MTGARADDAPHVEEPWRAVALDDDVIEQLRALLFGADSCSKPEPIRQPTRKPAA